MCSRKGKGRATGKSRCSRPAPGAEAFAEAGAPRPPKPTASAAPLALTDSAALRGPWWGRGTVARSSVARAARFRPARARSARANVHFARGEQGAGGLGALARRPLGARARTVTERLGRQLVPGARRPRSAPHARRLLPSPSLRDRVNPRLSKMNRHAERTVDTHADLAERGTQCMRDRGDYSARHPTRGNSLCDTVRARQTQAGRIPCPAELFFGTPPLRRRYGFRVGKMGDAR
jgi:hypothetical protein